MTFGVNFFERSETATAARSAVGDVEAKRILTFLLLRAAIKIDPKDYYMESKILTLSVAILHPTLSI